jgi:hypothetical protein
MVAGTMVVGAVTALSKVIPVTLSLDTSAYADGDLLADAQEITNVFSGVDGTGVIQSITLLDKDDQGAALDLFITDLSTTWGTENAAAAPTDAVADGILGVVEVAAADYVDLTNSQIVHKSNLCMFVNSVSGSTSMYIAAVARGAATYTASGITLEIGMFCD